jgi:sporulation protein YlmC with PRC-barrel domain
MTAFTQDAEMVVPANGGATILRDPDHISRGPGPFVMDAATLDGDKVVNSAGEDIGKIEAIMLDVAAGRIAYAVLSFGGFFGIGTKMFAIPWSALTLDAVENRFLLDISKERLESAPGFDEDHWPAMADRRWAKDVHAYYDVNPYWEDDRGMPGSRSLASAERYPPLP